MGSVAEWTESIRIITNCRGLKRKFCETSTARLNSLRKSREEREVSPLSGLSRIHCKAFTYGLKAVPFRKNEFFRKV